MVVTGGEVNLGHSQWNLEVVVVDTATAAWRLAARLEAGRRHHAAVLNCCSVYLVGGYGRHRQPLDTVELVELGSGRVSPCPSLPWPVRRPAAAMLAGRLVVVAEVEDGVHVVAYKPGSDAWERLQGGALPPGVDRCLAPGGRGGLYLTSTYSTKVHRLTLPSPSTYFVELVGAFTCEAGNTCMLGSRLYNFYSEEFGDERVVEVLDTETGRIAVELRRELPHWDLSPAPQYSYGCFPLLSYHL